MSEKLLFEKDGLIGNVNQYARELIEADERVQDARYRLDCAEQELLEFNEDNPSLEPTN